MLWNLKPTHKHIYKVCTIKHNKDLPRQAENVNEETGTPHIAEGHGKIFKPAMVNSELIK
jgi:hypothetical protein